MFSVDQFIADLRATLGIRLSQEEEYYGADLSVHKIGAVSAHD